jgi:L-threonylcarbamoyladenylate synthase
MQDAHSFAAMDFLKDVDAALPVLADGGLVLFPADQWWALGCDATNEEAAYNLLATGIQYEHPFLHLMVQEEKDILRFVPQPGIKIFDYLAGADKPSHAIYEHVSGIAPLLLLENESMAIRTPASSFCRHLVRRLRRPVITVAAAFPGQAAPSYYSEVPPELVAAAAYAVNYRRSLRLVSKPSSVVRWHGDGSISVFLS